MGDDEARVEVVAEEDEERREAAHAVEVGGGCEGLLGGGRGVGEGDWMKEGRRKMRVRRREERRRVRVRGPTTWRRRGSRM